MRWTLHYHPSVTAYLYALRLEGRQLHQRIKELAKEEEPWVDALKIPTMQRGYEINYRGHWIGFEMNEQEGTITILYIEVVK